MAKKTTTLKNCLFFALLGVLSGSLHAAPGDLDPSFDGDGKVTTRIGSSYMDAAGAVIQQADGKLVVAGASYPLSNDADFAILRYNADGTLDTSFDFDGVVTTAIGLSYDTGASVIQQEDGKLVVAGTSYKSGNDTQFALVRYNSNGTRDTGFGSAGKVITDFDTSYDGANAIIQQADGKLVVSGYARNVAANAYNMVLVRYNANGSLDTTFDTDGKVIHANGAIAYAMIQQPDGKLVIAGGLRESSGVIGNSFVLVRFNTNGSLDTTFGTGGTVTTAIGASETTAYSLVQQADGKLVAGGYSTTPTSSRNATLVRYNTDGSLDTGFGTGGTTVGSFGREIYSIVKETDGKLVVVGNGQSRPWIARFSANGIRDTSFVAAAPFSTGDALSVIRQVDGKLVMAGNSNSGIVLARFLSGQSDTDADGVDDAADNCPAISNADQINTDGDSEGNACDSDDDNDSVEDTIDAFPLDATESVDTDGDGIGNNTDTTPNGDTDNDGVDDALDAFPLNFEADTDTDADGQPDVLKPKASNNFATASTLAWTTGKNAIGPQVWNLQSISGRTDGTLVSSNAVAVNGINWMQMEYTAAQPGVIKFWYRCYGTGVKSFYLDGTSTLSCSFTGTWTSHTVGFTAGSHTLKWETTGGASGSGRFEIDDVEIFEDSALTEDSDDDNDGVVDSSDAFPLDATKAGDSDSDGIDNVVDNCPSNVSADQTDSDGDGQGNVCDFDDDNDGVLDTQDHMPLNAAASVDPDFDHSPTSWNAGCDLDCQNNSDLTLDNCPSVSNYGQRDADADGQGDACDADAVQDTDLDGIPDHLDSAPADVTLPGYIPLYQINGVNANDKLGKSVAGAGDIDADGYDDFIVGIAYQSIPEVVKVFSGKTGQPILSLTGDATSAGFGDVVGNAGDVNADGIPDIIVGDRYDNTAASQAGSVWVFSGANGALLYRFYGNYSSDNFGASVSGAGDVNNDGYDDVIVGTPDTQYMRNGIFVNDGGTAQVFSGATGAVLQTFYGDSEFDRAGSSVSAAGDINQDGFDDVLVAAPYDSNNGISGSATLYSGANGAVLREFFVASATVAGLGDINGDGVPDIAVKNQIYSGANGELLYILGSYQFVVTALPAGDVNNDGHPDIVIGNSIFDVAGQRLGLVDVYSGVDATRLYRFVGNNNNSNFGSAVSAAGDVNDDGYDDILVGAYGYDINASNSGSAMVYSGALFMEQTADFDGDGVVNTLDTDNDNDGVLDTQDAFPRDAAEWEDLDGNGIGDNADVDDDGDGAPDVTDNCPVLANADQADADNDSVGNACDADDDNDGALDASDAFPLDASESVDTDHDGIGNNADADDDADLVLDIADIEPLDASLPAYPSIHDVHVSGPYSNWNNSSLKIRAAGDVNNDGHADIVFSGNSSQAFVVDGATSNYLYIFTRDVANEGAFNSVSGVGDINKDGYDDFALGSAYYGEVKIHSGVDGSVLHTVDGPSGIQFGAAVSGAGDVNADGYPDFIVGAKYFSDAAYLRGSAYVYSGSDGALLYTFLGDGANNYFGSSVSGVGDVDQDGYADVIVGAPNYDDAYFGLDVGRAKVFSGKTGSILYTISGTVPNGYLGKEVSAAGDVNGDGRPDFVVTGGTTKVYSGATGNQLRSWAGASENEVSAAGDVNGDGYDDIISGESAIRVQVRSGKTGSLLFKLPGGPGLAGVGDVDGDGVPDLAVAVQSKDAATNMWSMVLRIYSGRFADDRDGDGIQDWVEALTQSDDDFDGVDNSADNCVSVSNADQLNTDGDSEGDVCDNDDDNDSVADASDAFPLDATESADADGDGIGNNADTTPNGDTDNDGVDNAADNCVAVSNTSQTDTDNDGAGDACDATPGGDTDGDNIDNATDNCVSVSNADQLNTDGDSEGDVCDNDDDNDSVADASDAFPLDATESADADGDGIGNNADTTPNGDTDNDGVDNAADNCVAVSNASQTDTDNDGVGDVCDATPTGDADGDGVDNLSDNCPTVSNADQIDIDADGAGDVCDLFPLNDELLLEQNGAAKNENFASSVAMADMNDDGVIDVLVGAPQANVAADGQLLKKAGVIRIISGADNSILRTLNGTVANQQFGTAIAVVDDQNSDSVPDVLVGEPLADITTTVLSKIRKLKDAGLVAVYSGSDGALINVIAEGGKAGDNFGAAVAVGDLNNDATIDLVVGVPMSDEVAKNAGQVTVFDGLSKTVLYARYGYQSGEHFGAAVAVGGGILFIGSPQFDVDQGDGTSLKDAGNVSGYFGYDEAVSGEVFAYYGGEQGDALGAAVAAAPNGDHVIGMPLADSTGKDSGSVMLYRMVSPNVMEGTVLSGATAGDNFGGALAIHDLDNDGVLDFAIGAAKFDVSTSVEKRKSVGVKTVLLKDAGRVEVLSGAALQ